MYKVLGFLGSSAGKESTYNAGDPGLIPGLEKRKTTHSGSPGLPLWLAGKESACSVGDPGSVPGLGRSPGGGPGSPLQCSCLENPMDREAWCATVLVFAKSWT